MTGLYIGVVFGRVKFLDCILLLMYISQLIIVEAWRFIGQQEWRFIFYPDYSDQAWWIFKQGSDQFLLFWGALMLFLPVGNPRVRRVILTLNLSFWLLSFICWTLFFNQGRPFFWCVFAPLAILEVFLWYQYYKVTLNKN